MITLPRLPFSPRVRRILGAATLGLGAWFIGHMLLPVAPRDVQIQVPLHDYREGALRVHRVSVAFERGDETVRDVSQRYDTVVPATWAPTVTLPEGRYRTVVTLELGDQVLRRTSNVDVHPGDPLVLAPPATP